MAKFFNLSDIDLQKISPNQLGQLLIEAKQAYYTTAQPIMSDHTYDTLENILRQKAPHHRLFSTIGNSNFKTGWPKKKHSMPMGSQNKATNYRDMIHYFELKKIPPQTTFVVQPKCDGISLELIYKQGQLDKAITRGDGRAGDLITQNVVKMKNCQTRLNQKFTGSIRCEIVVTYQDFQKIKQDYSNPRNAASGISQRLDSQLSQFCTLIAVDIYSSQLDFKTETDKITYLKQLKIPTVESHPANSFASIEKIYQNYLKKRSTHPFDIDGLVVKINNIQLQQKLGSLHQHPKHQIAYKFPPETKQTQILDIDWTVGPMGRITPVAKVEPVQISGAIINYISLANYQLVKQQQVNIGDIVQISRRGDVIPHLEKVVNKLKLGHVTIPQKCPSCHQSLIFEDKNSYCPNLNQCPAQILGSLRLFCQNLEIKGLSEQTIKKLYQQKLVKLPGDFYKLQISDIQNLDGLGKKSATNIINQIQAKRKLSLSQVFHASVIPNFSLARIKQITSAGYQTPSKIINIAIPQLQAIDGIQQTLATKIHQAIQLRRSFIQSILDQVQIKKTSRKKQSLKNLNFCITGQLDTPRSQDKKLIEAHGGKLLSAVSKNLSYLVSNSTTSNSAKFKKAQQLNIPIINQKQLINMINH
ncbi:hypothetical protein DRH14_00135 [Candidatus Shapirobacteria bacterium]|nr:MAG: hypothetical protein DRH14_00135 [Candidatus Shapirobacteria bacterium]